MGIDIQFLERDVEDRIVVWIYAILDGKVIGTISMHRNVPGAAETPFVFDRYVVPEHRGTARVGRILADALRDYGKQHGYTECYVQHQDTDVINNYPSGKRAIKRFERELRVKVEFVRYDANTNSNIFRIKDNPDG